MRILFTGGGTGGHVFPIIAVARQIKQQYNQAEPLEMLFLGPDNFSRNLLEQEGIKARIILAAKLRRYFSLQTILDIFKLPVGIIQAFWRLFLWMPDVIFSKGGYGSFPIVLVGWIYRIPILVHESDSIPGLANRLGAKFAKRIAISFESAAGYFPTEKTALTGNPVRMELIQACVSDSPENREKAKQILNVKAEKPIIFVMGGSQGAEKINQMTLAILSQALEKYEIIHQVGEKNFQRTKTLANKLSSPPGYYIFPFLDENQLAAAYILADLIISRAGAGSIAEISACGKPSILIPIPNSAADHQSQNAFAYARDKTTSVLVQDNLTPNLFWGEIEQIINDRELARNMSNNAKKFSRLEAAQKIAMALIEMGAE